MGERYSRLTFEIEGNNQSKNDYRVYKMKKNLKRKNRKKLGKIDLLLLYYYFKIL